MTPTLSRRATPLLAVQGLLLTLCAFSLVAFAGWVFGYNGLGWGAELIGDRFDGRGDERAVRVLGEAGTATAAAGNAITGGVPTTEVMNGDGVSEFYGDTASLSFWSPTWAQHAAWVAVRAVPFVGMAAIWWLLFGIVRAVSQGVGFTGRVSRRISMIGLLVLVGLPAVELARWAVASWLVESSTAAEIADAQGLYLPFWPFAVGVAVLVMASAWRGAAAMREDLDGLV